MIDKSLIVSNFYYRHYPNEIFNFLFRDVYISRVNAYNLYIHIDHDYDFFNDLREKVNE